MHRKMRRADKEVTDRAWMESIIRQSQVCRLAMCDRDQPYVIPMGFGYRDGVLYFHGAQEGRKIDCLRQNPKVCVEFDVDCEVVPAETASAFTMKYRSVIAFGVASFVEDLNAKREALDAMMAKYSDRSWTHPDEALRRVCIWKVDVEHMTGKQSGY